VLLVCGSSLWYEGIQRILSRPEDVEVLGPVALSDDAVHELLSDSLDLVVIVDRDQGGELEDSLTSRILAEHPDLPVVRVSNELRLYVSKVLPTSIVTLAKFIEELPLRPRPENSACPFSDHELRANNADPMIGP
jgi:hypothetical protein